MLKTAMLVSALALCAPALAQDQTPTGRTPMATDQTQPVKPAKKGKTPKPTETTTAAPATDTAQTPTTAAEGAPIAGAPVTEPVAPAETAAAPAPQTTPATPPVAPAETAAAPAAPPTPADPAATAAPAETAAATPAAAPAAAAQPAVTGATQIAQVVTTEFPTYDKNADTNLDKTEFGAWMVALKSASDPSTKATDPATVKWIDGAFASADTDKSKMVSKDELTKYLSQGAE